MKEPYREGVAHHSDPESCADNRKAVGEALTGEHADQVLSCEMRTSRAPMPLTEAEGNTAGSDKRESPAGPAQSETLCTRGNSLRENREVPGTPSEDGALGRSGKVICRTPDMHGPGKSDGRVVPAKRSNKGRGDLPAETVEGRSNGT